MAVTTNEIRDFFEARASAELTQIEKAKTNADLGFNVFGLVSDIYHRENFHSDVLATILDTKGSHGEGDVFLIRFLDLLNAIGPAVIDKQLYINSSVAREKGRRDITIYGKDKHAIIFENKINDAGDTFNQIPKYVDDMEGKKYIVDAVVYLTLNQNKEPDESGWQGEELHKSKIRDKLILVRAFADGKKDLCYWLEGCCKLPISENSRFVLLQYNKLMKRLTLNHIDQDFFNNFDKFLSSDPAMAEVAIGIRNSLEHYPYHILTKIKEYYKQENKFAPFNAIKEYTPHIFFLYDYKIGDYSFNTDIIINNLEKCTIDFSVRHNVEYQQHYPQKVLDVIGMLDDFEWNPNGLNNLGRYEHYVTGSFSTFELQIKAFLDKFLSRLNENTQKINAAISSL